MNFYILDFETNGLAFHDMEITQASILTVNKSSMTIEGKYNKYFLVNNLKDSAKITGLDEDTLTEKANHRFGQDDLKEIANITEHGIIVGQNINFDLMVYDTMCIKFGLPIIPKYPLDIIEQFAVNGIYVSLNYTAKKNLTEEQFKNIDLITGGKDFHDALYDVATVYELIRNNQEFKNRLKCYVHTLPIPEGV